MHKQDPTTTMAAYPYPTHPAPRLGPRGSGQAWWGAEGRLGSGMVGRPGTAGTQTHHPPAHALYAGR